ncbi:T9SS type A sorting domain-containing protein [Sanyastnella coralliicola]|uniref:T9SS type A sorting domain-containing protein n=1 Tax=Sanyastnella coralliicola TaxID=3069118 RepID=UPI0027B9A56A|nr:T9SS type A sorting domain-containing protein [Longitalea sp. SCSIO 12813]
MAYRFFSFLLFIATITSVQAQEDNLVPNPGFEERDDCDPNYGELDDAPPWKSPTMATPNVFHECTIVNDNPCPYPESQVLDPWIVGVPTNGPGCQSPHSGMGYGGFIPYAPSESDWLDWSEYLETQLLEPLIAGEVYHIRFYLSLAERSSRAISSIHVLLSPDNIEEYSATNTTLPILPSLANDIQTYIDDKDEWTLLQWEFIANGDEQYLYIGNFTSNEDTPSINAIPSDVIDEGHYENMAYYYIDDVYVGQTPLSIWQEENTEFALFPNPVENNLKITGKNIEQVVIYNGLGKLVKQVLLPFPMNSVDVKTEGLSSGIYYCLLQLDNGEIIKKKILKR